MRQERRLECALERFRTGDRRIGVAVSDPDRLIATPHEVIDRAAGDPLERIARLVAEMEATGVVVGLPTSLDGTEGPAAARSRALAEQLAAHLTVPVTLADERFTTVSAESALIGAGMRRDRRRRTVDMVAAAVMLQSHLDRLRHQATEAE